jgi:hypothetical protein
VIAHTGGMIDDLIREAVETATERARPELDRIGAAVGCQVAEAVAGSIPRLPIFGGPRVSCPTREPSDAERELEPLTRTIRSEAEKTARTIITRRLVPWAIALPLLGLGAGWLMWKRDR